MRLAALVCAACRDAWVAETRHATVRCPRCATPNPQAERRPLWQGDDPGAARQAVTQYRLGRAGAALETPPVRAALVPHDSPVHRAAAESRGIRNRSARAEAVARALVGSRPVPHGDLVGAMVAAGLEPERAEQEVNRMLATDLLMEPSAGRYLLVP